jgi:hypothetical protein
MAKVKVREKPKKYNIEIREKGPDGRTIQTIKCRKEGERYAESVKRGLEINMNKKLYYARMVERA